MEHRENVPTIDVGFDVVASTALGVFIHTKEEAAVLEKLNSPIDWTIEQTHPLHAALFAGRDTIALLLVEKGSPVTSRTLSLAYRFGNPQTFRTLLTAYAHTFPQDEYISAIFLNAIRNIDLFTVTTLLPQLTDINVTDYFHGFTGWTALHHACRVCNVKLIDLLLAAGADPNLHNNRGQTCLDLLHGHQQTISRQQRQAAARALLAHGACSSHLSPLQKLFLRYGIVV